MHLSSFGLHVHLTSTFFLFLKAPLMDSSDSSLSGTAVIMLVSVILMGLAIFVIYKFKRYSMPDLLYEECNVRKCEPGIIANSRSKICVCVCVCKCVSITTLCRVSPIRLPASILTAELLKLSTSSQTSYCSELWMSTPQ